MAYLKGVNLSGSSIIDGVAGRFDQITGSSFTGSFTGSISSDDIVSTIGTFTNLTVSETASIGYLETIYETSSIIYSSGSTKFGDTLDDIHQRTGSVLITGSLDITGGDITGINSTLKGFNVISSSTQFNNLTDPFTGSFTGSFTGDGSGLTNIVAPGTLSSSAQIASDISGAFTAPSESIASDIAELIVDSASFSTRVTNNEIFSSSLSNTIISYTGSFSGDGSGLTGVTAPGTLSSSAQIASDISGAFTEVSESLQSRLALQEIYSSSLPDTIISYTGSFSGDGSGLTGVTAPGTISSSAQIASDISGAFTSTSESIASDISSILTGSLSGSISYLPIYDSTGKALTESLISQSAYGEESDIQVEIAGNRTVINSQVITNTYSSPSGNPLRLGAIGNTDEIRITGADIESATDASKKFLVVGQDGQIHTADGNENISGSFSGSFIGNGSGLTNLTISQTATVKQVFEGTTWNVNHNLDTLNPIAQAYDENNFQILPQTVRIIDADNIQMTFPQSVSGSAVIAKGGHIVSGSNPVTFNTITNNPFTSGSGDTITISGSLIPTEHELYDLGSSTKRWRDLYLTGSTINLGGTEISLSGSDGDIIFHQGGTRKKIIADEIVLGSDASTQRSLSVHNGQLIVADDTGSEATIDRAQTASYIEGANVDGTVTTAQTSSYVAASSIDGTVTSASYALTASYAENAGGSGGGFPYTGSAIIFGSQQVTGSVGFSYLVAGNIDSLSTWASATAMNSGNNESIYGGTHGSAFSAGGDFPTFNNCTEEWNGSTWSGGGNIPNNYFRGAGAGTSNAGLQSHGRCAPSMNYSSDTNEYDGSSWSSGGSVITTGEQLVGTGTQNSALAIGGFNRDTCTEEYNGTSWAAGGALPSYRCRLGAAGTQNAGLAFGGYGGYQCTNEYDGTSWSAGGALINGSCGIAGGGTQDQALAFGGYGSGGPVLGCTEIYNGVSWSSTGALITARQKLGGAVTPLSKGLAFGGYGTCTEEMVEANSINSTFDYSDTTGEVSATGSFTGSFTGDGSGLTNVSADPFPYTGSAIIFGSQQVTGSVEFSYPIPVTAAWSAGGALITSTFQKAGAGTQNAGLAFGGQPPAEACTEEYDGSSWTAGGALIQQRSALAGAGTQNAGLAFGGPNWESVCTCTEEYDGSSWSAGGALINARRLAAGAGTQDAGLAFGGITISCTEEYDGSSWSAGGALITARFGLVGAGTQNAGLAFGGQNPSIISCTEEYDGSSWSTGGALITSRVVLAGAGTQNAGLAFGGQNPSIISCTEEYDGSAWSAGSALITGRSQLGGAGTQDAGLAFGGTTSPPTSCGNTEEYTLPPASFTKTFDYSSTTGLTSGSFIGDGSGLTGISGGGGSGFPHTGSAIILGSQQVSGSVGFSYPVASAGAWSAGGALITARQELAGAGTQNAGLAFGGYSSPTSAGSCTEEYDGTSWSAGGALSTARSSLAGAGTQDAGLAFAGLLAAAPYCEAACTEEYNGLSWSAGGALSTARYSLGGAGTQDAGLAFGGYSAPSQRTCTEEYNGTSWATGGALIQCRDALAGAGTQNAGLAFGGSIPAATCTEEYNGSSWSAGGALSTARYLLAGAGTQNAGLAFGGYSFPNTFSCTEEYDGSSWSAGGALITARYRLAGAGTRAAALAFGGYGGNTCTEEYTGGPISFTKTFDYSDTTGETTVSCLIETSAERYKDNIQPMGSQLNKVMQLKPVEFDWKSNRKHDIGFVADSVKNVYPNLVSEKDGQVEGMNYSKLVSALVKSIQEQQEQINNLKARLDNNK